MTTGEQMTDTQSTGDRLDGTTVAIWPTD
ncbi:MAG: hypothetical protein J07HX64_01522 [halophilic archaeon J07HX64]|nr:MAG: hypothetical protein J07HX64_01522 [halophilic archaeon J07HX64]